MKKVLIITMVLTVALSAVIGVAQAGIGSDIPDNGKHYNLQIIGVPKGKTADMEGSNGHTIFVPLDADGNMEPCKIEMVRNPDDPNQFRVFDRNACDEDGALIYVPWEDYSTLSYNVYAIALGKPMEEGVFCKVKGNLYFDATTTGELDMGEFELRRDRGKPSPQDISDIFRATGWIDVESEEEGCGIAGVKDPCDITFTNVWVFNIPTMLEYYWDYDANGLRHMQVRFYETTSGEWTNVPE